MTKILRLLTCSLAGLALLAGCGSDDDGTPSAGCTEGAITCTCVDGTTCDDGLTCDRGYCVESSCTPGQQECACDGGSCAGGLTCTDDVCVAAAAEGVDGGPCYANGSCNTGLECVADLCQEPSSCVAGSEGCACDEGSCEGTLVCANDLCAPPDVTPTEFGISVGNSDVRACDILIKESGATITEVNYADAAVGVFHRKAPQVALSFYVKGDTALAAQVATIAAVGTGLETLQITCTDNNGQPVADPQVLLGQ